MDEIDELLRHAQDQFVQKEFVPHPLEEYLRIRISQIPQIICQAYNHWFNVPEDKFKLIFEITEKVYIVSLIVDDIQDNSSYRGEVPVVHQVYGVPRTLNAVMSILITIARKLHSLENQTANRIVEEQLELFNYGQEMDIHLREAAQIATEFEYKSNAINKTGALYLLSLRLLQIFSTNKEDFSKLNAILAIYFQLLNDYSDLDITEYNGEKQFCKDITEGNFSFPIIHAIRKESPNIEILNILKQRTNNVVVKRYCLNRIKKSGSLEYTKQALQSLKKLASKEIARLGSNPLLDKLLDEVVLE